jgi:hypothetical protein
MVRHTQIAGIEVPVSFGNAALIRFEEETGISILTLGTTPLNYKNTLILIYEGIRDGYRKAKKNLDIDFDEMCDLLDEEPQAINRIVQILTNSLPMGETEEKKRKVAKK